MNQIRKQQKKKAKLQHKAVKLAALFALKMMISQKEKKEALAAAEGKTTSGKITSKIPDPMHVLYFALGGKAAGLNPKKVEKAAAAATLLSAATTVGNAGGGLCLPEADGKEECEKKPDSLEEIEPAFMSDPPDETEPVNMFDPLEETAPEVKFNLPEETEPEIKYDSLAQMILEVLSPEDGMHLERILEQISSIPAERRTFAESFGLSVVIPCLLRLKMDGRVEETSAGYFRKTR